MRLTGARGVLQVHPTRRCNLTCAHCYSDSGPRAGDEMPLEVLEDLVTDAAGYEVTFSQGCPVLARFCLGRGRWRFGKTYRALVIPRAQEN